jgi:hypothetical protein
MRKIAILSLLLFGIAFGAQAQKKLSKDEIAKYENEINNMISYLEETMNFLGDSTALPVEKEIVFTESWSKVFIDDKVQIEDDLDPNRNTPINKDVQAYLKDIDFFFKYAVFKLDLQSIANNTRDDGTIYFKATLTRHLTATTINDEKVDNVKNRYVEINLDRQNNSIKIASIYTTKINEKDALRNWWNGLSQSWKNRLGNDILLDDGTALAQLNTSALTNTAEFDAKLKLVTQKQRVDLSGIREIISLEPLSELSDLTWLDVSGTSIEDLAPVRNLNKLKVLKANSTLINDLSALKYNISLEELEVANTTIEDLGVLTTLRNLQKLNINNTQVSRISNLKSCPNLTTVNLGGTRIANIGILQELEQLKNVDISNTSVRDLGPLRNMKDLQSLNISGSAVSNLQALSEMQNLRELYCSNTSVSDLSPLNGNRHLSKIYCDHSGVHDADASAFTKDNPNALVIYDTEALKTWWRDLPIYWKAVFSKQIKVDKEPTTEQLHQIINLQELDLSGNTYMQNLMPASRLTNLRSLNIANTEIGFLQPIQGLANLESLNISHTYINDLKPLQDMGNLKYLNIMNTPVNDLSPLVNDNNIEVIEADSTTIGRSQVMILKEKQRQVTVIYQTESLKTWWNNLDPIWQAIFRNATAIQSEMPNALELQRILDLREIEITPEHPIVSIEPLTSLMWLERLTINNQGVSDLTPLTNKEFLLELNAQNNPIGSLDPIENSTLLELLNIENTQIKELGPLSRMNNLVTLNASGTNVKSLKPLSGLQKLENLFVNNTNVRSISPVENMPSLKQLKVYNTKVKKRAVESLQHKRLDLNIIYY